MLARLKRFANGIGANSCCLCRLYPVPETGLCEHCNHLLERWYPRCCQHLSAPTEYPNGSTHQTTYWFAALRWNSVIRHLIQRYKQSAKTELAIPFARWLSAHLYYCYHCYQIPLPDLVVAVPTTQKRWYQRGFHHTGLLAQLTAAELGLEYQVGLLRVIKDTSRQKRQSRRQRFDNAQHSMHCTRRLDGLTVAVVDDIISTGATLEATAAALKKKGAKEVHGWALVYNH